MKLDNIDPFKLTPNPWNSNKVNRENFEKLKKSLANLGSFKPIIVRENGDTLEILGGYHRCEAAKELGIKEVPVINLGKLEDERAKEISLIDNTRYGQDDAELLSKLLDDIDTDLMLDIMPDIAVELPDEEELTSFESDMPDTGDDLVKTLHFKMDIDKAEEIEGLLAEVCSNNGYKHKDGFYDYSKALYHVLILDKKDKE